MKRFVCLSICVLLLLAGCATQATPSASTAQGASSANLEFLPKIISGDGNRGNNGYYRTVPRSDTSNNIHFVDYTSKSETILCSRPECTHDNGTCPAWVPYNGGGVEPVVVNDKLLLVYKGNQDQDIIDALGEVAIAHIEIMDLNGLNRSSLTTLSATDVIRPGYARSDQQLFFVKDSFEDAQNTGGRPTRTLCALDVYTGSLAELTELDVTETIIGTLGNSLVLSNSKGAENVLVPAAELETAIRLFSVSDASFTMVTTHPYLHFGYVSGNQYYMFNIAEGIVSVCTLEKDAKTTQLYTGLFTEALRGSAYKQELIWDNKTVVTFYVLAPDGMSTTVESHLIDLDTGKVTKLELYLEYSSSMPSVSNTSALVIIDEYEDYYLVIDSLTDIEVTITYSSSDIVVLPYSIQNYALILKTDFWDSARNLIPIEKI